MLNIKNNIKKYIDYNPTKFDQLPISECKDEAGNNLYVEVYFKNKVVTLKVWQAVAGNIKLYFLDSDIEQNTGEDRKITYQLYGGDKRTRILQEIVLGIGGVRALRPVRGGAPSAVHPRHPLRGGGP
ncbi:MAG: hypothetical protein P8Y70_13680, partial [Candidatus Lokiarchaeota archaeon]